MPIYAYRCASCGHAKDVLRKISDPVLTVCPVCGEATFEKQLTAAGFQLKGSGWYVTDFKGDKPPARPAEGAPAAEGKGAAEGAAAATPDAPKPDATPPNGSATKSEAPAAPAASVAPAAAPVSSGTGSTGGREP